MMTIGNHELRGKVEKLANPFLVMKKVVGGSSSNRSSQDSQDVSYEVAAIIKKKLLFTEYPNAIIR